MAKVHIRDTVDYPELNAKYRDLVSLLDQVDAAYLGRPSVVVAFLDPEVRPGRAAMRVHWISDTPLARGIQLSSDKDQLELEIPGKQQEWNEAEAPITVLFHAEFWFDHQTEVWQRIDSLTKGGACRVALMTSSEIVSVPAELLRIEREGTDMHRDESFEAR
jgi:hypothetical protein